MVVSCRSYAGMLQIYSSLHRTMSKCSRVLHATCVFLPGFIGRMRTTHCCFPELFYVKHLEPRDSEIGLKVYFRSPLRYENRYIRFKWYNRHHQHTSMHPQVPLGVKSVSQATIRSPPKLLNNSHDLLSCVRISLVPLALLNPNHLSGATKHFHRSHCGAWHLAVYPLNNLLWFRKTYLNRQSCLRSFT